MGDYVAIISDYYEIWNVPHREVFPLFFSADNLEEARIKINEICYEKTRSIFLSLKGVSSRVEIPCLELLILTNISLPDDFNTAKFFNKY